MLEERGLLVSWSTPGHSEHSQQASSPGPCTVRTGDSGSHRTTSQSTSILEMCSSPRIPSLPAYQSHLVTLALSSEVLLSKLTSSTCLLHTADSIYGYLSFFKPNITVSSSFLMKQGASDLIHPAWPHLAFPPLPKTLSRYATHFFFLFVLSPPFLSNLFSEMTPTT